MTLLMNKPLLIFDGDCGFCRRWIERWRRITGNQVDYKPYQEVGSRYPEIPKEKFQQSVQLIEDLAGARQITSGAEAVFRALAHHPQRRWLLGLYQKSGLFRNLSEGFYNLVAGNRVLFSKLTQFSWGGELGPFTYQTSSFLFLKILALIYAIAFYSIGTQVLGLFGSQGVLPAAMFLKQVAANFGAERFWVVPTLAWINHSDFFLQFLCAAGMILSGLLFAGIYPVVTLSLLWLFYLSLVAVGQDFLSFQWDNLLLEAGFLAIFLAPLVKRDRFSHGFEPPKMVRFLFKWLLFRLVFLSGMAKLASGDTTWRTLTALAYHYETQPLPPWTAWYAHHLPLLFQQASAVLMFLAELIIPFLFFAPRRLRYFACAVSIGFQLLIMVTGNYCFFNLLAIALCLLLLDDTVWQRWIPVKEPLAAKSMPRVVTVPLACVVLIVSLGQMSWMLPGGRSHRRAVNALEIAIDPFRSVNRYGLFAVMTTTRREIVIEGSNDAKEWKAYEFKYKPGDILRRPGFVQPLQPRLDWQMWFAALGRYQQNPWLINLCARLMQGSPQVLRLLANNPFPEAPPRYIRAKAYLYHFSTLQEKKDYHAWWRREENGLYCPMISLEEKGSA